MALASPRSSGAAAAARASSLSSASASPRPRAAAVAAASTPRPSLHRLVLAAARPLLGGSRRPTSDRQLIACRSASSNSSSSSSGDGENSSSGRPASTTPAPPASQQQQHHLLSADDLPDPTGAAFASAEAAEKLWRRLTEARREMAAAVDREDFGAAARLRDEARTLAGALSPVRQYVLHQLERLRTGEPPAPLDGLDGGGSFLSSSSSSEPSAALSPSSPSPVPVGGSLLDSPPGSPGGGGSSDNDSSRRNNNNKKTGNGNNNTARRGIRAEVHGEQEEQEEDAASAAARRRAQRSRERLAAVAALGEVGDAAVLPDLARALRDPELQPAAQEAMWAVFGRSADPRVAEMMEEGGKLLGAGAGGPGGTNPSLEAALAAFERVLELAPDFAEAHNKRATVLYLLGRHEQAVAACAACLAVNPWHFGAASGAGLCHVALQRPAEALAAFERALEIHPGLTQIARYAGTLRGALEEQQMRAEARQRMEEEQGGDQSGGEQQEEGDGGAAAAPW
jgi:tetratricopeptide (TPR) repeat protein